MKHQGSCDAVAQGIIQKIAEEHVTTLDQDIACAHTLATLYVGDQIAELVKTLKKED